MLCAAALGAVCLGGKAKGQANSNIVPKPSAVVIRFGRVYMCQRLCLRVLIYIFLFSPSILCGADNIILSA